MFNRVALNKDDVVKLSVLVKHLQSVLGCCKKYDQLAFKNDMVESFKPMARMCKAIKKEVDKNHKVDITSQGVREHYLKTVKSIESWGKKYDIELVNIIVRNGVQAVLKSNETGEGFTFTII